MTVQPGTAIQPYTRPEYLLTAADRCDQCGARAYVHTILATTLGELYWCYHHWNAHRKVLRPLCTYVNDETRALFAGVKDDRHVTPGKEVSLPPRKTFG